MTRVLWMLASSLGLAACASSTPCSIPSDLVGNAGCLILHNDQFLVARHRQLDKWNLPGGTKAWGESAQCTAQRETREELGVEVNVGPLLIQEDNGFYLFRCDLLDGQYQANYPVPASGASEVSAIAWLSPEQITAQEWRYPQRWSKLQRLVLDALYE